MDECRDVRSCRICDNRDLTTYLDLGNMPLVNRVLTPEQVKDEKKYPLKVLFCDDCKLSQLSTVVDPEVLFGHYVYRSSISDSFKAHCKDLSDRLNQDVLRNGDLIVDIASNDGALLTPFRNRGNRVLGVDPARNLAEIANKAGIETLPTFWNEETGRMIANKYGPAKAITAFNVFAHVDDLHSFLKGVNHLLAKDGRFIVEFPYLYHLTDKSEFDTVYHEHLSYFLVKPIERLVKKHGLVLSKAERQNIHGGSIRLYVAKQKELEDIDGSIAGILAEESNSGLYLPGVYRGFQRQLENLKENFANVTGELKGLGKKICGFGASAKGNILLNLSGLDYRTIDAVFDDTPEKQGKLYPGVHIPIVSRDQLKNISPDYLVLLSWNFAKEMMDKTKDFKERGGKYIVPLPYIKIV